MTRITLAIVKFSLSISFAQASVVNGDFETGDLTGWSTAGSSGDYSAAVSKSTTDPHHFSASLNGLGSFYPVTDQWGSFLFWGLSGGTARLSQSVTAAAGDILKFDLIWAVSPGGNSGIDVVGPSGKVFSFLAAPFDPVPYNLAWKSYSVTLPQSGTYKLSAFANGSGFMTAGVPHSGNGFIGLDSVRVVPEPATLVLGLLAIATGAVAYCRWR